MKRYWEYQILASHESSVQDYVGRTRRTWAECLLIGSSPKCAIRLPVPCPGVAMVIERSEEQKSYYVADLLGNADGELFEQIPELTLGGYRILIRDITEERSKAAFEPELWSLKIEHKDSSAVALWHVFKGEMHGTSILEPGQHYVLSASERFLWDAAQGKAFIVDAQGIQKECSVSEGRKGMPRVEYGDHILIITPTPSKESHNFIPANYAPQKDSFMGRVVLGGLLTWAMLMGVIQLMPRQEIIQDIAFEELTPEMKRIILEPSSRAAGNRQDGGGGVETAARDERGGSGFQAPLEVQVKDVGAVAAIQKMEKTLGTGLGAVLAATSAMSAALGKMDEAVQGGQYAAAAIGGRQRDPNGVGSATGVLGALSALGAKGAGGAGVGVGGVGTRGFGNGGAGGKGEGFGTGVGAGLGKGQGPRDIAFADDGGDIRGGLEKSEVDAVVRENIAQIRFCYNRGLRSNPSLQGKVLSDFTIAANGKVRVSRVAQSTLAAQEVESCISGRIANWTFPQPRGGGEVTVRYPFLLKPGL